MSEGTFFHVSAGKYIIACAPSEDPDQPVHPFEEAKQSWLSTERLAKTDQITQMRRLIIAFTVRLNRRWFLGYR